MTLTTNITKRASSWAVAVALTTASAASAATLSTSGTFGAGEVATFEFTLGAGATFLDLTTNGSTDVGGPIGGADTQLAFYSGTGPGATYLTENDDLGLQNNAVITLGVGSGMVLGDRDWVANGFQGSAPAAGVYTAVVAEYNTFFPSLLGDLSDGGNEAVNYELSIFSDAVISEVIATTDGMDVAPVPLPAGGLLLISGLAGVAALKRRKKRAA